MKKSFFTGNKMRILFHLLVWIIILGLPLYVIKRWNVGKDFIWLYYINIIIGGIIFYTNYLFLVPVFFFDNRRYRYYLSVIVLIACFFGISDISNQLVFKYISSRANIEQSNQQPENKENQLPLDNGSVSARPPFREMHMFNYGFSSLFFVFLSLGLRILERHSQIEKLQEKLEKEKLNSELAFLKNQISPHFFFNTLNNIYSLINTNADDSQKAVLKLSKLMRYLLYESEQGHTRLSNEIEFMNNYVDLMKLRISDKINLSVKFPGKYEDIYIPALLFIPFIENAFKHGISYRERSFIDISMLATKDSITFRCANSLMKTSEDVENRNSGIGLENVSKRLSLLFPDKHELKINRSDTTFEVLLHINFT